MKKAILILCLALSSVSLYADADAGIQMRLADDAIFQRRIQYILMQEAFVVLAEPNNTFNHQNRVAFARQVQFGAAGIVANSYAIALVGRPNLVAATTTCNEDGCTTDASDAAIFSQIATDWNMWAGTPGNN